MRRRILAASAGAVLMVALAGSAAYADIPAADGTIHGCYLPGPVGAGQVFVIDSEDECPAGMTAINWQSAAPVGIAGYEIVTVGLEVAGPRGAGTADRTIECPAGKAALGASFRADISAASPQPDGSGWDFTISHPSIGSGATYTSTQSVTCATAGS